jgi:hypothetical protein
MFDQSLFGEIMMFCRLTVVALCAGLTMAIGGAVWAAPLQPTEARIIDNFEQLGIDTATPRFGWVVNDAARGAVQSAYQLVLAGSKGALDNAKDVIWDSGKVASSRQYGVVYGGRALEKTTEYWWKVRTWDAQGEASPWSDGHRFITSFFKPQDWNAQAVWIGDGLGTVPPTKPAPQFRKEFQVNKPIRGAYLYICGLGQFTAHINGARVGDHIMDPAWTDYDRTSDYVTFDVTSQVGQGGNALGVHLANGWLSDTRDKQSTRNFGPMRMIAQLHIVYQDGTSSDVVSDPTWKTTTSPLTHSEIHGSENYDARLEQAGWSKPGFDDSKWTSAVVVTRPSGELVAHGAPPMRVREVFAPQKVTNPSPNIYVYDFGKNMNGQFEITVKGSAGQTVTLRPGEDVKSDGRVNMGRAEASKYTLKGSGSETWGPTLNAVGFRYLEVEGATANPQDTTLPLIEKAAAHFVCAAVRDVGTFTASDKRYTQIHDLALQTLLSNTESIHTDGPNYERLGWQEVVATMPQSLVYTNDVQSYFAKIMRDVRDAQRDSGLCPDIAPNWYHKKSDRSAGPFDDSPAWGSSAFICPWVMYQTYGDTQILSDNYETMKKYLAYLKGREANGLVTYGLGDWMAPAGNDVRNVEGAIYVYDTGLVRDIATALGKTEDASTYDKEYTRVRDAYNRAYFDPQIKSYQPLKQANEALPLVFGIVPDGEVEAVRQALVNVIAHPPESSRPGQFGPVVANHVTTGDIATSALWQALGDAGQGTLVQTMIMQETTPSYMYMISHGATTIAENWLYEKTRSHNHDMYAGIMAYLYRNIGGISALTPGYEVIQIKPTVPLGLNSASTTYDSVRGPIETSWRVDGKDFAIKVRIPANASAIVTVPAVDADSVREGDQPAKDATGVKFLRFESSAAVFSVGSGTYNFTSTAKK